MHNLEILAPAGSEEALKAAVMSGADAVYLATTKFGARASAKNFSMEQLRNAVDFCHKRDVRLYLTMNTLLTDGEIEQALETAKLAASLPVDAIIVQDTGFAALLHKAIPDLKLHASTQMSIHTPDGAKLLYSLGFSRVVLARELSLAEIEEIAKSCPIELEVFVHGALCMCVSGQCYFSSVLGSRSGNRGQCAQTCRLPFSVEGGSGHDLSLKDMSILEHLRRLEATGVTSAKIEGRLKRPEYVACSVNTARQFLDNGSADEQSRQLLKSVFSRSGFTDGYYKGIRGKEMFGIRQKEDVISATSKVLNQIHSIYKNEFQRIPVKMDFSLNSGIESKLEVSVQKNDITCFTACEYGKSGEKALNKPLTAEKAVQQLSKTGNSPYKVISVNTAIEPDTTIPISELNSLRRNALDSITEQIFSSYKSCKVYDVNLTVKNTRRLARHFSLRAVFSDWDIPQEFSQCEIVFIPEDTPEHIMQNLINSGFNLGIEIYAGMFGRETQVYEHLRKAAQLNIKHVLINNLASVPICKELGFEIHGNFRLNVTNTESISFLENLRLSDINVSFELTLEQINSLGGKIPIGTIVYGRLPLMLTRNCPGKNSSTKNCSQCGGLGYITDRKNIKFPYKCGGGCTQIFNSVPVYMGDRLNELYSASFGTMLFTTENTEQKLDILKKMLYEKNPDGKYTRGLYYKGII